MSADRDPLEELIGSVSDGSRVDWDATLQALPRHARRGARNLRDVARIASFHRQLQHPTGEPSGEGEHWGPLLLLDRLGSGTSADVYRAWDPQLRREVALKLLRKDVPGHSPLVDEGRAAARIRHPNVVTVHGIAEHEGRLGLWMELIAGRTLEAALERQGPASADQVLQLARELGAALAAVHAEGLLHRDLKPANVVRDLDGRHVLTDFGLGTRSDEEPAPETWRSGTPMYMAPELLDGEAPSVRSDVYALGMLLRFAALRQHPFHADTLPQLRAQVRQGPQPRLATARPDLPANLASAIERAIAPDPADRFPTAAAFLEAIAPVSMEAPRPRRVWVPATMALAVVAIVFAWMQTGRETAVPAASYDVSAGFLRRDAGGAMELVSGDPVRPGDHLSLRLSVSKPSWVYVLNEDDEGRSFLLFPQPLYHVQNPVPAGSDLVLPGPGEAGENAWTVTSVGGREHFLVVVSPEPVPDLEAERTVLAAPKRNAPIEQGEVRAETIERLRGVGGVGLLPSEPTTSGTSPAFAHFRSLAGRETGVRGVWVRYFVLVNSG